MMFSVALLLMAGPGIRVYAHPTGATVQRRQPLLPIGTVPILSGANGTACTRDEDCYLACCAFNTGICSNSELAQHADTGLGGCGFGNVAPNCQVSAALGFTACVDGAVNGTLTEDLLKHAVANFELDSADHGVVIG
ncbi:hypothetical protein C8R46DRAFT_610010 [Mycena filopes]|nr:hypothetical protein C8R46DRAFT_610010 [Mycena filopes]